MVEQDKSFQDLNVRLANHVVLGYFRPNHKIKLIVDVSPVGLGAVLVQIQDGEEKVTCYASHSLSDTEKRYFQAEKEALVVVWSCEQFYMFIWYMICNNF